MGSSSQFRDGGIPISCLERSREQNKIGLILFWEWGAWMTILAHGLYLFALNTYPRGPIVCPFLQPPLFIIFEIVYNAPFTCMYSGLKKANKKPYFHVSTALLEALPRSILGYGGETCM